MPSSPTAPPDTEELARFRQRWKEEIRSQHAPAPAQAQVPAATGPTQPPVNAPRPARLRHALENYTSAVLEEQRGNYPEATRLYRNAFRQDPNVDKAYHREELLRQQGLPASDPLSKAFSHLTFSGPKDLPPENEHVNHSLEIFLRSWPPGLRFEPENEAKRVPIAKLPDELIIHILFGFARNLDTSSIERFAMVCRRARVLSLDNSLWRRLVEIIMVPPQLDDPTLTIDDIGKQYHYDYRRVYIEHPHIRFDGVYIAICHYIRNGAGENPWVVISHLITYRRFLRFFPNGKVLSYRANDDQEIADIVHELHPGLQRKDLCVGDWQLTGNTVVITNLMDVVPGYSDKYSFQIVLGLKSRPTGKWNKLDIHQYESVNMETGDIIPFSLKHDRPYWFSKVKSYRV
ncbi:hypothetical protein M422DRAFT_219912 [Sphaerobolus stellatus SS14]|nr:hypothetical protein M422DRAFT_219912 [Sphaerobolus stellatus SS14]